MKKVIHLCISNNKRDFGVWEASIRLAKVSMYIRTCVTVLCTCGSVHLWFCAPVVLCTCGSVHLWFCELVVVDWYVCVWEILYM